MIGAVHLQNAIATGEGARRLQRVHIGFGAGVAKADQLERRHPRAQELGELEQGRVGSIPGCATTGLCFDCSRDHRMSVTVDQRRRVEREVEQLVAIDIDHPGAAAIIEIRRVRLEICPIAGVATGQEALGVGVQSV